MPPQDPQSNFALAHRYLLEPLGVRPENIHRIRGEDPPERAAAAAARELSTVVPARERQIPVLDLIFLGMGEDGHVASLFPDGVANTEGNDLFQTVIGPKPPPQRITMTYPVLNAATAVWVLVSGPDKEKALLASLQGLAPTPLARVLQARTRTTVFTDIQAPGAPG